jgi:formate dehydrogenase iron-sulfur subunit
VLSKREEDGRVWKCTLCYDRLKDDKTPACAQACPTQSIQFGDLDELRERATARLQQLTDAGAEGAQLYLSDSDDGVHGAGAFFLLLDDPEVYGLPPDPVDPTHHLGESWRAVGAACVALGAAVAGAFLAGGRR